MAVKFFPSAIAVMHAASLFNGLMHESVLVASVVVIDSVRD